MSNDVVIRTFDPKTKKPRKVVDYDKPLEKPPPPWEQLKTRVRAAMPKRRPKAVDHYRLTLFTRQFAVLLHAGVPMSNCFDSFTESSDPAHVAIQAVAARVQAGHRLSQAMRQLPHAFSPIYCGLVESGEKTGRLVEVLFKLADDLEKQLTLRKKMTAAMTYPVILLICAFLCVGWFVTGVLPLLEPMFISMHIQLPFATRVLLHSKQIIFSILAIIGVLLAGGYFAYKSVALSPERLRNVHRLVLWIPLFGSLYKTAVATRIMQSLATMLEVGITVIPCLKACESLTSNQYIAHQVSEVKRLVVDGETIGQSLLHIKLFPRAATQLISVGEESSNLIEMLQFAARMQTEDCDTAIEQMAASMEPVIMLTMGIVVGFIVLGAMLPIVQLIQNL